ncbi:MAG: hypothetical protein ACOYH4_06590 [Saccharofermentanales bacterium]|jgi:hypothetical protein
MSDADLRMCYVCKGEDSATRGDGMKRYEMMLQEAYDELLEGKAGLEADELCTFRRDNVKQRLKFQIEGNSNDARAGKLKISHMVGERWLRFEKAFYDGDFDQAKREIAGAVALLIRALDRVSDLQARQGEDSATKEVER